MQTGDRLSSGNRGRYYNLLFDILKAINENNGKSSMIIKSYIADYCGDIHITSAVFSFLERKGLIRRERDSRKIKVYMTDRARWILNSNHNGNDKPVWTKNVLSLVKGLAGAVAHARYKRKVQRKRAKERARIMARLLKKKQAS